MEVLSTYFTVFSLVLVKHPNNKGLHCLYLRGKEVWLEVCFQDEVVEMLVQKEVPGWRELVGRWQGAEVDLRWGALGPQVMQGFHGQH